MRSLADTRGSVSCAKGLGRGFKARGSIRPRRRPTRDAGVSVRREDARGDRSVGQYLDLARLSGQLLWTMLYNTGARVSEVIAVRVADVGLDASACVHLHGKGRKQRAVPSWKSTVQEVRAWLRRSPPTRRGIGIGSSTARAAEESRNRASLGGGDKP